MAGVPAPPAKPHPRPEDAEPLPREPGIRARFAYAGDRSGLRARTIRDRAWDALGRQQEVDPWEHAWTSEPV